LSFGGFTLSLGTKLTLYISFLSILILSGYGYLDTLSRRDILVRKMKAEARTTGRTLEISLERASLPEEKGYIQGLIDAVTDHGRTLGVIAYYQAGGLVVRSHSLEEGIEPYLNLIKVSIKENRPQEEFGVYRRNPIFSYVFPLKDRMGKRIGGVSILQQASFMEKEIENAKWNIFVTIFVLIGAMVALVLLGTRKWATQPIAKLVEGTKELARGNLDHQIDLKGKGELSELAGAFNQMATDLKKAQRRIVQEAETRLELERGLRESEKLATIGQLASGLAHEIGTPLNIIVGRAELIRRKPGDQGGMQKNLGIIIDQTERVIKIIQELLGFARKKKAEQVPLNICVLLGTTLDLLDHQIQKQRVWVVKDLKETLPPLVADPDQLQQVFLNLILNAIQSMPEGGKLFLSASVKEITKKGLDGQRRCMEVCVEDTGAGMGKEVLASLFNPFFTTKEKGTGLGLMVTQGIVQDHDGWIEVESEKGKGSTFKVYFPLVEGESPN
jgi:two-component system, NtrC family, sensor kinase